jgi:hypothetical protein
MLAGALPEQSRALPPAPASPVRLVQARRHMCGRAGPMLSMAWHIGLICAQKSPGRHVVRTAARQGTAAVVLAGVLAAQPLTGVDLAQHTFMLVGDGAAGTAIAEVLAEAVARRGSRCARRPRRQDGSRFAACGTGGCHMSIVAVPNGRDAFAETGDWSCPQRV